MRPGHAIVFKSLLKKHGVRVVSITEPSEDTPTGKLMEAIIESLDEFYSANLAQDVLRGMREAASRGYYMGSVPPYGYRRVKIHDGKKERPRLELDDATAPVVRRMFQMVAHGAGLKDVTQALNGDGIAGPSGRLWTKTAVHRILTNEAYMGTLVWGRTSQGGLAPQPVRVEGAWEALVDRETFEKVVGLLKGRAFDRSHPRRTSSRYLLSGLLQCGSCGGSFGGQEAKSGQFAYYVCGALLKRGKGACDAPYLNARRVEALVVAKIKERILTEENLLELVRLVNEELDATAHEYRDRLNVVEADLADVNRRLERLYDVLETGKLNQDDLYPRLQLLRHRQDQLRAARADIEDSLQGRREQIGDLSEIVKHVDGMRSLLMETSLAEQRAFIKSFVQEIVVTGQEAILRYTLPLPPDRLGQPSGGGEGELYGVPAIVHGGTPARTRTGAIGLGNRCSIRLSYRGT